jgi:hypothetical protein
MPTANMTAASIKARKYPGSRKERNIPVPKLIIKSATSRRRFEPLIIPPPENIYAAC